MTGPATAPRAVWLDDLIAGIVALSESAWGFVAVGAGSHPVYLCFRLDERPDDQLPFWEEDDDPGPPPSRRILVEATASEHLSEEAALSPEQEAALVRLQWPPRSDCTPEACDIEHLDWFCFVTLQEGATPSSAVIGLDLRLYRSARSSSSMGPWPDERSSYRGRGWASPSARAWA